MAEPVTLYEAKAQCRVLHDDEDDLITGLIIAAREWVENFTGHILVRREVMQRFDRFDIHPYLYAWPIAADASVEVTYLDNSGETQTVPGAQLAFGNGWAQIMPAFGASWPSTYGARGAVTVTVEAGYEAPDDVPQSMKQAMLLLIGTWYSNREASSDRPMTEVPFAVEALCRPYRLVLVA